MSALPRQNRVTPAREMETREAERHDTSDDYQPAQLLAAPPARPGMQLRWVREFNGAVRDTLNLARRMQDGYRVVTAEDFPNFALGATGSEPIRRGNLVLMECPVENAEKRLRYQRTRSLAQLEQADDLQGLRITGARLPITREYDRTEVIAGGRRIVGTPD